ncbi:hypothetical protein P152DRAFT_71544 [Eremomyces bilateralis CBS 781.70]|uniref:PH domain-containing protein n=1 Tax=Eremomyces bilateralis CBS 781.70 TaxID=1392243 RepID=A0A6G1FZV0_9PEZI|nr:uncharacterized protein P152DRAFT_71544 [Eremomyces bilateralis CBS 781.70]KAF1811385.1 hypothetical protein P152DRAFT_71544 [Eremomyces bilateralis CBS 781.70]
MATAANRVSGSFLSTDLKESDPFVSPLPDSRRHRYSGFDNQYMSLYSTGSPSQAKKALEAHLAETERRIQEASQLGSVLASQKDELADQLKEVGKYQAESEIGPDLKQKLIELEREYNEVGKETARAFIPRSRVPSNESATDGSSTLYSAEAQHSPSKIHAPLSRKQRNQGPSRVNDIQLATEISSSLLNQVRELQAAYAEKDDALKSAVGERSQLELERDSLLQRVRNLDESEQRYKDENWSLETQLHEHMAAQKEAADKEQKLNQGLNIARSERTAIERELEELKQVNGKLSDDLTTTKRQNESELSGLRRNVDLVESDRGLLQRKIDELTSQNQELAKAMAYRLRQDQAESENPALEENEELAPGRITPDHSPPPSPTKATPRHGHLESETLKSSLNHAYRMIQNLKNNIHREKTEKIELKRMLQDARDELEVRRGDNGVNSTGKKRKPAVDAFKKPARPDRLGLPRGTREEILMDDPDWEEHDGQESPTRPGKSIAKQSASEDSTDHFETATEHSEAFETANEREGTETEAFQTGVETLDGASSDDLTETETTGTGLAAFTRNRKITPLLTTKAGTRSSFLSTASTSGDEFDDTALKTPVQSQQRYRLKMNRPSLRKSRESFATIRDSPAYRDSPASVASTQSAQSQPGQNLLAELGNLSDEDSDDLELDDTPSRSVLRTPSTGSHGTQRRKMVDSASSTEPARSIEMADTAIMTEPLEQKPEPEPVKLEFVPLVAVDSSPIEVEIAPVKVPQFTSTSIQSVDTKPIEPEVIPMHVPKLTSTIIRSVDTAPIEPEVMAVYVPKLTSTTIQSVDTTPVEPEIAPVHVPKFASTGLLSVDTTPIEPDVAPVDAPKLIATATPPVETKTVESEFPPVELPKLSSTLIQSVDTEPIEPQITPVEVPAFTSTTIQSIDTKPVEPVIPAPPPQKFSFSFLSTLGTSPIEFPAPPKPVLPPFSVSSLVSQGTHPEPFVLPTPPIVRPVTPELPPLSSVSAIFSQEVEPVEPPRPSTARRITTVDSAVNTEDKRPAEDRAIGDGLSKSSGGFVSLFGRSRGPVDAEPQIIEDETSQPPRVIDENTDPDETGSSPRNGRKPFQAIDPNAGLAERGSSNEAVSKPLRVKVADESTQTQVSSADIDQMMAAKNMAINTSRTSPNKGAPSPTIAVFGNVSPRKGRDAGEGTAIRSSRRPGSAGSVRSRQASPPPLPSDHKEAIAAAAQRASTVNPTPAATPGLMGPPMMPASAYKVPQLRPRTPSIGQQPPGSRGGTTPRPAAQSIRSGVSSPVTTRRSSVSSFASELDQRFNIQRTAMGVAQDMMDAQTDPRMIQAITQTMIGEYLWKYTRKAGSANMSENRHRRFFWVHPYTRTLYWSEQDPASAGRTQLKAKSVAIEAVRVVTDDNPLPPGLHRKSLVVITPGRSIKFTAPTSQRHETWFNALSYLLLRTGSERTDEEANLTAEDVDEFNPTTYGRSSSRATGRSRASLSSYNSRTTMTSSPQLGSVTLKARHPPGQASRVAKTPSSSSRFSTIGTMLRNPASLRGSFSSRHSRAALPEESIYDASVMHDSMEDLRQVIEKQERDADRLENVRACCDGKHDVGSLSRASRPNSFASRASRRSGSNHAHHHHSRSVPPAVEKSAQASA